MSTIPGGLTFDPKTQATLDTLRAALARRFGQSARLERVALPTLGGANQTIVFDLVEGTARRRLVSRQETLSSPTGSPFLPTAEQFRMLRVAFAHGVLVPEPVLEFAPEDGLGEGYLTAFVDGETMPKRILNDARFAAARDSLAGQSARALAALHRIPVGEAEFLAARPDSVDPIAAQLARLDACGEAHPAVEVGVRWLHAHRPKPRRQIVHGDYRTGNLLVSDRGLEAVLDWECAHLGSGHEDLGWLCMRSWRFGQNGKPVGGFGARAALYEAYEAASGEAVDPAEVHFWEIFGLVRWVILNVMQAYGHEFEGRRSVAFAAAGRNAALYEYDLLMTVLGHFD